MSLSDLPPELKLMVSEAIQNQQDLLNLTKTNHAFHTLLQSHLIPHNIKHHHSSGLSWAARTGNMALARKFLQAGANPNARPVSTAEYCAPDKTHSQRKRIRDLRLMETPLYIAVENRRERIVLLLLHYGGDPRTTGWKGSPGLDELAVLNGNFALGAMLRIMVDFNVRINFVTG
ncbi:hypothetical protein BJX76DRAFT_354948 [Aspergillus varians]